MTDLERWLSAHGREQYAKHFAANDIDLDVLGSISDADLAELGLSLGHRRKLLSALEAGRRESVRSGIAGAPASSSISAETHVAERRQITVLFCDLVGSTELANTLDPEDVDALIRHYQDACSAAVARFDGYVAKFMGDGVLAYFGYPQAKEDAAERAVRSALAIVAAVGELEHPDGHPFAVRIGIATGIVVVGDMLGAGSARERSIAGDTPNLAARLQALAAPNEIMIGARTTSCWEDASTTWIWASARSRGSPSRCRFGACWVRPPRKRVSRPRVPPAEARSSAAAKNCRFCSIAGGTRRKATGRHWSSRAKPAWESRGWPTCCPSQWATSATIE